MEEKLITFAAIAEEAGFTVSTEGHMGAPPTPESVRKLKQAVQRLCPHTWDRIPPISLTLQGPGPVWAYLAVMTALVSRVGKLAYVHGESSVVIWNYYA